MMIDLLLQEWQLTTAGKSVPRSHASLIRAFEGRVPERSGQQTLNYLLAEGLVDCTVDGGYILTGKGCALRKKLGDTAPPAVKKEYSGAGEWVRFKKLLAYYSECILRESRTQDYLFAEDKDIQYFVPALGFGWLKGPGEEESVISIDITAHVLPYAHLSSRQNADEELYIGYPLEAFENNGKTLYTPIGMIPVDIVGGSRTTADLKIRCDEASLNINWMDFNLPKQHKRALLQAVYALHQGDEYQGCMDLAVALPIIERYSRQQGDGVLNPNRVEWNLPVLKKGGRRLCNTPVLFVGSQSVYTANLRKELRLIGGASPEELDKTALAYVFREHPFSIETKQTQDVPLEFIDCNDEQRQAVFQALNNSISKVTGPPGTGKSQVAVNIIANLLYRGRSVLFTSRNHKAVHAIGERCCQVSEACGVDLVTFCSDPDGNAHHTYYNQDLEQLAARAQTAYKREGILDRDAISACEESYREMEQDFADRNDTLARLYMANRERELMQMRLERILPQHPLPTPDGIKELHRHVSRYRSKPEWKWGVSRLMECLRWKFGGESASRESEQWLRENYEPFFGRKPDPVRVCKKAASYMDLAQQYGEVDKEYRAACENAKTSSPVTPEDVQEFEKLADAFNAHKSAGLLYQMTRGAAALGAKPREVHEIGNIVSALRKERPGSEAYQKAAASFHRFLACYPAWAVTLLSLGKASPCLPAIYDHVLVDEVSQCDIASVIPALFRAKHATFIGDPNQFPPVINLLGMQHDFIKQRNHVDEQAFDYKGRTAYDVLPALPVMLKEHYRCAADIVQFCNSEFYSNELIVCTDKKKLKFPASMGFKRAMEWVDVPDSREGEIAAVEAHLKKLIALKYDGSVGVITPFRALANDMANRFQKYAGKLEGFQVNTANAFQGGERDLIIFVLGYNSSLTHGQNWYAETEDNRYIYNVAVSRARACLLVVGDRSRCRESGVKVLQALAAPRKSDSTDATRDPRFDSVWEQRLYDALLRAGIETQPQYRIANRRLDMAYEDGGFKLDIEVDGVRYHVSSTGGRKMDDIYRDLQLRSLGWAVQRFWVYELERDMEECVRIIKGRIKDRS